MDLFREVALRLDDQIMILNAVAGGEPFSAVIEDTGSVGPNVEKHLAPVQFESLSLHVGFTMSDALFDWITAAWQADDRGKDGAILVLDPSGFRVATQNAFFGGRLVSTTFPTLDAVLRTAGDLVVGIAPNRIAPSVAGGEALAIRLLRQRLFRTSEFRLQIDGLDCSHVRRIESFTVPAAVAGAVDFPDLSITLALTRADSWFAWFQDFVIAGNSEAAERRGTLTFLTPNRGAALATIGLEGLGIFKLAQHVDPERLGIRLVTASLYCERMTLQRGGAT